MDETQKKTIERWLSDGTTWVGVFENKDLSHPDIGRRTAVPYDMNCFDAAVIGRDRAPEFIRQHGMIPWQYILVEKCKTLEEVEKAMNLDRGESSG